VRYLLWILFAAGIYGAIQWQLHDRPIPHPSRGMLAGKTPDIALGATRPPWKDANGFRYRALADFQFTAVILSRNNYSMGEFASLSPTDLAIGWGALSDPVIYRQFKFDQRGSPLAGRFVFPEVVPGTAMAALPLTEMAALLLATLTHVHTIPANGDVRRRLAGIRPGQVATLKGVLVEATAPSGDLYRSSLKLFDYECEIMWVDDLALE
jgi:hypothetical protein